ncbi:hypothetical protein, partial [Klebsiella pneumoniae]|uniref:hypothetical protein n=1 Tax=Klebsiella pneumoniae TaxID=573 RepID=UPI001788DBC4
QDWVWGSGVVLGWVEDWALELVEVSALALVVVQELVQYWHWVVVAVVHWLPVLHSQWVAPLLQEDSVEALRSPPDKHQVLLWPRYFPERLRSTRCLD